jgi:hypothetical protein
VRPAREAERLRECSRRLRDDLRATVRRRVETAPVVRAVRAWVVRHPLPAASAAAAAGLLAGRALPARGARGALRFARRWGLRAGLSWLAAAARRSGVPAYRRRGEAGRFASGARPTSR